MSRQGGQRGPMGLPAIVAGTLVSVLLAFFVSVWLPISGGGTAEGSSVESRSYDATALLGRTLYIREGCFSCHTQGVRDTFADSQLGQAPSDPGLYTNEAPNLIGVLRLGPDLACVGDREDDPTWYVKHLSDPESVHEHSTMPSYDYLSAKELQAIAAYLLRLTCEEGV